MNSTLKNTLILLSAALLSAAQAGCDRKTGTSTSATTSTSTSTTGTSSNASDTSRSAGSILDDGVITTKIKAALATDPDVKSRDISVETRKGEVILSGFVDSQSQIDKAITIARGVDGVTKVDIKLVERK